MECLISKGRNCKWFLKIKFNLMKITPLEIRQKTFEKVFRGYEKDEVNAYLQSLSMEWERLLDENKELYQRIENLEAESSKLRELESSLFKTLKTAEDTGATLIEQAKKETDLKLKESQIQAETILSDARGKAKKLVENAEAKRKQILDEMMNQVKTMERLFNDMIDLKEKIVGQVKSYSHDLMTRIENFEKKSENLQVQDMIEEAKKIYNASMVGENLDFKEVTNGSDEPAGDTESPADHVPSKNEDASPEKNIVAQKEITTKESMDQEVEDTAVEETAMKEEVPSEEQTALKEETTLSEEVPLTEETALEEERITEEEAPLRTNNSVSEPTSLEEGQEEDSRKKNEVGEADIKFDNIKKERKNATKSFFDEIE
jgi:cell division initiation protein